MKRAYISVIILFSISGFAVRSNAQDIHTINTAAISEEECDANSPAFQKLLNGSDPGRSYELSLAKTSYGLNLVFVTMLHALFSEAALPGKFGLDVDSWCLPKKPRSL